MEVDTTKQDPIDSPCKINQIKKLDDINSNVQEETCLVDEGQKVESSCVNGKKLDEFMWQQKDELDYFKRQLAVSEHKYLTDISKLKSQIQSLSKVYETAKNEKESAFMRYVLKEKEILDLNNEKKKLLDGIKEKEKQIVKLKTNNREATDFLNTIEIKNKELKETKICIEILKEEKLKILKDLECWKIKHEQITKTSQESESKLKHEIETLQVKLEALTKENEAFNQESNLEKLVIESQFYVTLKEHSDQLLDQVNVLNRTVEDLNCKLTECASTITSLENVNIDLKTLMESNETRTKELLLFTESISSLNASLQTENTNLHVTLNKVQNNYEVLKKKNNELKSIIINQKSVLETEKNTFENDKKELANHLAKKMQMVDELKTMLERTQDDLHVSKKKFKSTVAELTKELKKKNMVDTSVEMKMILDKMVKLQQENARISEKLDFVEDHNAHLLLELKKKRSIILRHGLSDKNTSFSKTNEQKNKKY
ncbi:coiled-coil domain-containing protein 186-like [Daktulosphaira vitifoliae]|uniref:coiled-coil domain-containing protein 186-like n=1 Tax=Daktulosphaira vitifoliae TaxID=58002 RepID=UPI0021A98EA2|nr:coiled-coil domain-containing protein 186-like [Daktulosphaira vitifoliae]